MTNLRIDPRKNRLYVGEWLQERTISADDLKDLQDAPTTLVIGSESSGAKKKTRLKRILRNMIKKKANPLDIHEMMFLPAMKDVQECRVLESYDQLGDLLRHPVFINSTNNFTFDCFTSKICDFLIVHKRVRFLTINEIRVRGLATVIKHNPELEILNIRFMMIAADVLSLIEVLFITRHKPCTIQFLNCFNTREISTHLASQGFTMESSFNVEGHTVIRVTHKRVDNYFAEVAYRRTLSVYALRRADF